MWVIKLGGSLDDSSLLRSWLDAIVDHGPSGAVIVPGGGKFAQQVRIAQQCWRFDELTAHRMAILAMQQMALMLQALRIEVRIAFTVDSVKNYAEQYYTALWSPKIEELDAAHIPASWDITSDSLAAWLANELRASQLILVKSAPLSGSRNIAELIEQGIVDKAFAFYSQRLECPIKLFNRDELQVFRQYAHAHL